MNISPISAYTPFCARLEMSPSYERRLYGKNGLYKDKAEIRKIADKNIERIENSSSYDTYRLDSLHDIKRKQTYGARRGRVVATPINYVYKNDEEIGSFPGREKRFIGVLADSLEIIDRYSDVFKKLNMEEADVIRIYNEISEADDNRVTDALEKIRNTRSDKILNISSRRVDSNIFGSRQCVLTNAKGRVIKKKTCPMADFVVYVANKYFKK